MREPGRLRFYVVQHAGNLRVFLTEAGRWTTKILQARRFEREADAERLIEQELDGCGLALPVITPKRIMLAALATRVS